MSLINVTIDMDAGYIFLTLLLYFDTYIKCYGFDLTILHTNDVHARIEEFDINGDSCKKPNQCYGGVSRRYKLIQELRQNVTNVLLVDAGDRFSGTMWFDIYKGNEAALFMNYSRYDAMAVGNHEFDKGPKNLINFINSVNFTVLSANIDASNDTNWKPNKNKFKKSTIILKNGKRIGIIGYTAIETEWLSSPGEDIKFTNIITEIREEVKQLKKQGVNIIIALGHAGLEKDRQIAQQVDDIDIVVGGHTHTFLYTGTPPSNNKPEDVYPIIYTSKNGHKTLVVQDFEFGKYLGRLNVKFNDLGEIQSWSGNPILLDKRIQQDKNILKIVTDMGVPIQAARLKPVGRTAVYLEGSRKVCRAKECNLGNLVADAIVKMNQVYPNKTNRIGTWVNVALGLWNGGGIRGSIDKDISDNITVSDIKRVLPFGNSADLVELYGTTLKDVFEHSVSSLPALAGRFLQVSGFRVKYNLRKPIGQRVVELKAMCIESRVPKYELIKNKMIYKVIIKSYMVTGGDGYTMLKNVLKHVKGKVASEYVMEYLKKQTPVAPSLEERIIFVNDIDNKANCKTSHGEIVYLSSLVIQLTLISLIVFLF